MWNNIAVVKDLTVRVGIGSAIVWSGIFRITIKCGKKNRR